MRPRTRIATTGKPHGFAQRLAAPHIAGHAYDRLDWNNDVVQPETALPLTVGIGTRDPLIIESPKVNNWESRTPGNHAALSRNH